MLNHSQTAKKYSQYKGFRQNPFATGAAPAYLVGKRKDTSMWEVVDSGVFDTETQSRHAMHAQYDRINAHNGKPALYTWLGCLTDETIKAQFSRDAA
jgi:hypothetical protein